MANNKRKNLHFAKGSTFSSTFYEREKNFNVNMNFSFVDFSSCLQKRHFNHTFVTTPKTVSALLIKSIILRVFRTTITNFVRCMRETRNDYILEYTYHITSKSVTILLLSKMHAFFMYTWQLAMFNSINHLSRPKDHKHPSCPSKEEF